MTAAAHAPGRAYPVPAPDDDDLRCRAESVVTAYMHDDRALVVQLLEEEPVPHMLALALAELVVMIHSSVCEDEGVEPAVVWQRFLASSRAAGR